MQIFTTYVLPRQASIYSFALMIHLHYTYLNFNFPLYVR